ncbi:unnamed protein product, partial [Ectocarpus sp. 13 AM-2016]
GGRGRGDRRLSSPPSRAAPNDIWSEDDSGSAMGDGGSFSDAGGEGNFAGGAGSSSGGAGSHACRDASVSSDCGSERCGSERCGSESGGDLKGMAFLPPSPMDRN